MAVTLTGTEGLFTRLGHLFKTANDLDTFRGATSETRAELIDDDFDDSDHLVIDTLFTSLDTFRDDCNGWLTALAAIATNTLLTQVDRDAALIDLTLAEALGELVRQMKAASASINRATTSATPAYGASNSGDSVVICSLTDGTGTPLDAVFAETIRLRCDGGDEFAEQWTYTADGSVEVTDHRWPRGSGATGTLSTLEPGTLTAPSLLDGGFESWTDANTPDEWTATVGTGGTDFIRDTDALVGTYCLKLVSDGATATSLYQVTDLEPNTVYAVSCWAKKSANDASGVISIRLTDSAGTVLADDAGTDNEITATLASGGDIATTYTNVSGFFRTPRKVSNTDRFQIVWDTLPAAAVTLKIDSVVLEPATQAYPGGPFFAVLAGGTAPGLDDSCVLTIANDLGKDSFARSMDRFFSTRDLGITIPSIGGGSETISDSLIA